MKRILSPVLAAALVSPMALLPAAAQTSDSETSSPAVDGSMDAGTVGVDTETNASGSASSGGSSSDTSSSTSASDTGSDSASNAGTDSSVDMTGEADPLIVTVGDAEITASDVQAAIEGFPPQLAQQVPPEQLISVAVDQLVLRELILQRAEQENLSEDPEVQQMIEENGERSREDAIVQIYVQRAMDEAVSDEAVQGAYDDATSQTEQELPPIDQVRPQIEQQLRQERLSTLRQELIDQGTEITFYDENGEPVDDAGAANGAMSGNTGNNTSGNSTNGSSTGNNASGNSTSSNTGNNTSGSSTSDSNTGNNRSGTSGSTTAGSSTTGTSGSDASTNSTSNDTSGNSSSNASGNAEAGETEED